MVTTYPVYTPTEPVGPPPRDLLDITNNLVLVGIVKDRADFLTTNGRMYGTHGDEMDRANHRLKHALNIITRRCRDTAAEHDNLQKERDDLRKELDNLRIEYGISSDLVKDTQNKVDEALANVKRQLADIQRISNINRNLQRENNNLQEQRNRAVRDRNAARAERDNVRIQYGQVNAQLGQANNLLGHANNRVQFGINALARLRNRFLQQIAALRIQVQWFRIRQLNPPPPPLNNPPETIWLRLQ